MAKSTQLLNSPDEALKQLLDRVSSAREELGAVEKNLERLRQDIAKAEKEQLQAR